MNLSLIPKDRPLALREVGMGRQGRQYSLVAVLGWLFLATGPGYGAGFALYEAGARSSALTGAMVARADDLSAIFYNPAGLVQLPGFKIMGGFSIFLPRVEVETHSGPAATRSLMESSVSFAPHLFTSYKLTERVWLGLGVNFLFGLGIQYNDNWPGRFNVTKAAIQTLNLNPTIAVKVTDYLSIGAGLDIMYFKFNLKRMLPIPLLTPQALDLQGDSWGLGAFENEPMPDRFVDYLVPTTPPPQLFMRHRISLARHDLEPCVYYGVHDGPDYQ